MNEFLIVPGLTWNGYGLTDIGQGIKMTQKSKMSELYKLDKAYKQNKKEKEKSE